MSRAVVLAALVAFVVGVLVHRLHTGDVSVQTERIVELERAHRTMVRDREAALLAAQRPCETPAPSTPAPATATPTPPTPPPDTPAPETAPAATCPACPTLAQLAQAVTSAPQSIHVPQVVPYGHVVFDTVSARIKQRKPGVSLHIVSHSHWDREWYRPLEAFARLMVSTVDNVVAQLVRGRETGVAHFHWDSQSVLVEDYLAARPEAQQLLVDLINNNQLGVGPWYTQPDEFLVSGEALVRNLLYGIMALEQLNATYSSIGYIPDQFGHTAQMPQIFAGFGLVAAATMRGTPPGAARNNWWEAPDGTRILLLRFPNYCGVFFNEGNPSVATAVVNELAKSHAANDGINTLYFMNGCDHRDLDTEVGRAIQRAQGQLNGYHVLCVVCCCCFCCCVLLCVLLPDCGVKRVQGHCQRSDAARDRGVPLKPRGRGAHHQD